jgi:hypothetical protein
MRHSAFAIPHLGERSSLLASKRFSGMTFRIPHLDASQRPSMDSKLSKPDPKDGPGAATGSADGMTVSREKKNVPLSESPGPPAESV